MYQEIKSDSTDLSGGREWGMKDWMLIYRILKKKKKKAKSVKLIFGACAITNHLSCFTKNSTNQITSLIT